MNRRETFRTAFRLACSYLLASACLLHAPPGSSAAEPAKPRTGAAQADTARTTGGISICVFSNFEGGATDALAAVRWFEACSRAHPEIRWTHLYNPWHLAIQSKATADTEPIFSRFLLDAQSARRAEVGMHIHLYYELVRLAGVEPRGYPYASDPTPGCNHQRAVADDRANGYDVLLTGYSAEERSAILDFSLDAFRRRGFERPRAFCAGYSATDKDLQKLLADRGFAVSFAAQVVGPGQYGRCWGRLLEWSDSITPLTIPYRVSTGSILPPPHPDRDYLDLVEVPLNLGVDAFDLYHQGTVVTREAMFDAHFRAARDHGVQTAVAIGVHAEQVAGEVWGKGPIAATVDSLLKHVAARAAEGGPEIRYETVSAIARRFWENTTRASVARER